MCRLRLRVRLCGRRPLNDPATSRNDLPSLALCRQQAAWLRGGRSRLLRRAGIHDRQTIVELGAGWGIVSNELCQRTGRRVTAIDPRPRPRGVTLMDEVDWVVGKAEQLPLADRSVDLVFAQLTFLWLDAPQAIAEVTRVLVPGGVVAMLEPDYGGLMEHPESLATRSIWLAALRRAGADPCIGRKLPGLCTDAGLRVETRFPDRYEVADAARLDLLAELPLLESEQHQVAQIRQRLAQEGPCGVAHLPLWMVLGEKP